VAHRATPDPRPSALVTNGDDLVRANAAGGGHIDDVSLGLANQRARDRRRDRDAGSTNIGLVIAHDGVRDALTVVLSLKIDRRTEDDLIARRQLGDIDDLSRR